VAAESLALGIPPVSASAYDEEALPGEVRTLQMGDPDVDVYDAAFVGEETVGGEASTPDQDSVDDIGRAYGVSEMDSGALRSAAEILERRDRRRRV
jgi:hypothetical protein